MDRIALLDHFFGPTFIFMSIFFWFCCTSQNDVLFYKIQRSDLNVFSSYSKLIRTSEMEWAVEQKWWSAEWWLRWRGNFCCFPCRQTGTIECLLRTKIWTFSSWKKKIKISNDLCNGLRKFSLTKAVNAHTWITSGKLESNHKIRPIKEWWKCPMVKEYQLLSFTKFRFESLFTS